MRQLRFRIVSVDMNGLLGREHHPEPTDVGLIVTPIKMETEYWDNETGAASPMIGWDEDPDRLAASPALIASGGNSRESIIHFWTCVTESGRLLTLADYEVEPVAPEPRAAFREEFAALMSPAPPEPLEIEFDAWPHRLPLDDMTDDAIERARYTAEREAGMTFHDDDKTGFPPFTIYCGAEEVGGG